jgi:MFS family permease
MGAFISALDIVVVATALPTMQAHLGASLADLEWTINAYSLAFGCLMLTGAALGDRFGRRRMYVTGLVTFVAGSIVAALAPGTGVLIGGRVIQGAGAALLMPRARWSAAPWSRASPGSGSSGSTCRWGWRWRRCRRPGCGRAAAPGRSSTSRA